MPDDNVIDENVVRISPDLKGFRRKLQTELKKETAGVTAKAQVVAELRGFRTELRDKLRTVDVRYKVKVEADARYLHSSIRRAVAQAKINLAQAGDTFTIKLDVDDSALKQKSRLHKRVRNALEQEQQAEDQANYARRAQRYVSWQDKMNHLHGQALTEQSRMDKAASDKATRLAELAERDRVRRVNQIKKYAGRETYGPKLIDLGGQGVRPMNALYGVVAAMTPALFAMAASAVQASTSVAALGAAGIGAAAGITAVVVSFTRVTDALKLRDQVRKQGIRATAKAAKAESGYADAVRNAVDQVQSARRGLRDANRAVADSERNLADAVTDAREARLAINQAYRDAATAVRDLREEVSDLAIEEMDATLSVQEAQQKALEVNNNFWASDLERRRAALDLVEAQERLSDTQTERTEKTKLLAKAEKDGLSQSDEVTEARKRSADADRRVIDQQITLADSHERVADAQKAVARAQKELATTKSGAGVGVGSEADVAAAAELAAAIAAMSPAARKLYYWFDKNQSVLDGLRSKMEAAVLPGFLTFLEQITAKGKGSESALSIMAGSAATLGEVIGRTVGRLGKATRSPWFRSSMVKVNAENAKSFNLLGDAAVVLVRPLTRIVAAAAPLFTRFSEGMLSFANWLDRVIESAHKSGALADWFDRAGDAMGRWVDLGKAIIRVVMPIFTASLPAGNNLVERLTAFMTELGDKTNSTEGMKAISGFFDKFKNLKYGDITQMLGQLAVTVAAFKAVRLGLKHPFYAALALLGTLDVEATGRMLRLLTNFAVDGLGFIDKHQTAAGTLLAIFAAAKVGGKVLDIGVKLPALDNLKGWLTGKFKPLDTLFGGAKAANMTVHAGVVNILGGAGLEGAAAGGVAGAAKTGGALSLLLSGPVVLSIAGTAYELSDEFQRGKNGKGFFSPITEFFDDPSLFKAFKANLFLAMNAALPGVGPLAWGIGAANRPVTKSQASAIEEERKAFVELNKMMANNSSAVERNSRLSADQNVIIQNYIATRRTAVTETANAVRATEGDAAAQKYLREQNVASQATLATTLTQLGWNTEAAKVYAEKIYGIPKAASTSIFTPGSIAAKAELETLSIKANALDGEYIAKLSTKGYKTVKEQLDMLYAVQHVLYNPTYSNSAAGADTISSQNQYLDPKTGLPKPMKKAAGGHIHGPGSATSDSIPAMLSNGEYVQPTNVVKHYGSQAMENIRQKRIPREILAFAGGGQVAGEPASWPFLVNLPKKGLQLPDFSTQTGGGPGMAVPGFGRWPSSAASVHGRDSGVWRSILNLVNANNIPHDGYGAYNNRRTLRGGWSWHAAGRAVDFMGYNQDALAQFFMARKPSVLELIHSTRRGNYGVSRGHDHNMGGALYGQHRNHLHVAMAKGGLVPRTYDSGGALPPGVTLAVNNTGHTETIRTAAQEKALTGGTFRLDKRDLILLAQYITAASQRPINMDGRRVAEIVFGYDYLPGGV